MGVKIVFGTDIGGFPWPEIPLAKEFAYYVQWGMTPMQAIKSATSLAAELLQATDDLGAVAPVRRLVAARPAGRHRELGLCGS
jgi:imidazolonepropionase-like amidohydrolase